MSQSSFPPWRLGRLLAFSIAVSVLCMPAAVAQYQSGNVFGTVSDNQDVRLPGVTVTLSGVGATQVFVSDAQGEFRFLNLAPGRYTLNAELAGFGSTSRTADVNVGRNTSVELTLRPAMEQTITVTAETPLLDVRKTGTGATVTQIELQELPSARDPWVVLQQVPGVLMDRINVGGNESGQQSGYVGKGASGTQSTWNVDGVNITDMAATGASPAYYDFDAFEEMQVTTGGTDPSVQTPGVNLNMVTKRGSNELRGSVRYFITDNDWQAETEIPAEAAGYLFQVNEINHIEDMGFEIGGPIIRDRLWLWGGYGEQNIENFAAAGLPELFHDDTFLTNFNFKLNAQILNNNSATGTYSEGSKEKFGRNVSPSRPPETAWNQGVINKGPIIDGGPIWKIEDTHIFNANLYLTGLYAKIDNTFFLTPVGGMDVQSWRDESSVNHRTFYDYGSLRVGHLYRADGSSFFDTGAMNHELRFGFGYRETPAESFSVWPGGLRGFFDCGGCSEADNFGVANIWRSGAANYGSDYTDFYLGDTILMGNWTFQAGLRYDLQTGNTFESTVAANPVFPEILPGASYAGGPEDLEWSSITPRLGVTYTMGDTRRTVLRGAYNQYADQLGSGDFFLAQPFYYYQYLAYYWDDSNANRVVERGEVLFDDGLYYAYLLDPDNLETGEPTIRVDYDMDVPTTDEFILGFEHELLPEFTVGLNYTHRSIKDLLYTRYEKNKGAGDFYTTADYEFVRNATGTLPDGTRYSIPINGLKDGVDAPIFGVITNRPGYQRNYDGIELLATKRLSNRWMMRANLAWNEWKQDVSDPGYEDGDPTPRLTSFGCSSCDGSVVVEGSGTGSGAKGNIYINSRWSYNVTGLVQLPWQLSLGASLSGREGYPLPYYHRGSVGDGRGAKNYLIDGVDPFRFEDIMVLDMRLGKEFRIMDRVGVNVSIDAFNLTDERTILQREHRLYRGFPEVVNAPGNRIREMVSPRVFRLGARLTF